MPSTGADLLINSLIKLGVKHLFSISGNQILSLYDATIGRDIDIIHTRHEATAVHMADGWGRLTGKTRRRPAHRGARALQRRLRPLRSPNGRIAPRIAERKLPEGADRPGSLPGDGPGRHRPTDVQSCMDGGGCRTPGGRHRPAPLPSPGVDVPARSTSACRATC